MPQENYNNMTDEQVHGPDLSKRFEDDEEVAMRIHGMPFQATREEVYEFFADYKVVPDTLIFGLADDGRKSGLGALIFETEEDAQKAAEEKDKQYIGSRFVNLSAIPYARYKRFNKDFVGREREVYQGGGGGGGSRACFNCQGEGHMSRDCPEPKKERGSGGGGGGGGGRACFKCGEEGHMSRECPQNAGGGGNSYGGDGAIKLSDKVNDGNKAKALMMRGIPFRSTMDEIIGFFDGHGVIKEEDITIEEMNGRRTGSVLVVFENTDKAQGAKEALQKGDLGGRYIDLFDENDSMMQRICRL